VRMPEDHAMLAGRSTRSPSAQGVSGGSFGPGGDAPAYPRKSGHPYRLARRRLPLGYDPGDAPPLPGSPGADGSSPPSTAAEARAVGAHTSRDGFRLSEVFEDALRRWPGDVYGLSASLEGAAFGRCETSGDRRAAP
jgi:hypothetical protein